MTQYAQISDGRVRRVGLPEVGTLADGRQVSGYSRLDPSVLAAEGWVAYSETRPEFDPATESLVLDRYEVTAATAIGVYRVEPLPPPEPAPPSREEFDGLTQTVEALTATVGTSAIEQAARDGAITTGQAAGLGVDVKVSKA